MSGAKEDGVWGFAPTVAGVLAVALVLALEVGRAGEPPAGALVRAAETVTCEGGERSRGLALLEDYECARCHESELLAAPPPDRNCTGCHQQIRRGELAAPAADRARWKEDVRHLLDVPRLDGTGERWRNDWLVAFLLEPHDLRPGLGATMPRFALSREQAEEIAAVLAPSQGPEGLPQVGSEARGRRLFDAKGCGNCHVFADRKLPPAAEVAFDRKAPASQRLAPDLRHARVRFRRDRLAAWIQNPRSVVPSAQMPSLGLSDKEAHDLATYVMTAPLRSAKEVVVQPPQPLSKQELEEPVAFAEVNSRVFRGSCWHCHSDPDFNGGDGGPGNTGGFGFAGIGLDLSGYSGVAEGAYESGWSMARWTEELERTGLRGGLRDPRSHGDILEAGDSRLVRALRARKLEERGQPVPGVRGMPLGLPSLSEEEIRLVERWVAQGALL